MYPAMKAFGEFQVEISKFLHPSAVGKFKVMMRVPTMAAIFWAYARPGNLTGHKLWR